MNADAHLNLVTLERDRLKHVMGTFATGVTIVSTHLDGIDYGMTCNSFNTVSLDPPMVLWSIRKESASRKAFVRGGGYSVSVLTVDQHKRALQFTKGAPEERFAGVATRRLPSGRVVLDNAAAWFDCEIDQIVGAGDHDILIGRVLEFGCDDEKEPLVYLRGNFTRAVSSD